MEKNRVFYYESEKDDFFFQDKPLPKIDEHYRYKKGFFGKICEFFLHRIVAPPIAFPYIKLCVKEKYYGKKKLKPYRKQGYFLYLNHTQVVADAVSPNVMIFPKKLYIIVNKEKGMVVHPGNGNYSGTLVNALMYSHKDRLSAIICWISSTLYCGSPKPAGI